ncbi:MAG: hypothetical protein PGN13_07645 [Patulibacter minatonensis]
MTFALAQSTPQDTSSGAGIVFAMLIGIALLSILALTPNGRRFLMPTIAILLGLVIIYTTIADAVSAVVSVLTILGLFIGATLVLGGFGALREGITLPEVEGVEPEIEPQPPRIAPTETASTQEGASPTEVD